MSKKDAGSTEESEKLALLETSYREILDATKHQDDKIGRILTGIAFLTAAALAFANQTGIGIATRFAVSDRELPLLAFAVGAFVIGVVLTVSLLLSSLTTGLTLPGSAPPSRREPGKPSSLIYFYSIARVPKEEWRERWNSSSSEVLNDELRRDYIDETYNLAQRTNHKYTRTNEAAAALSLTFFALGVSFILGLAVATTSSRDGSLVPLTWQTRAALAAFIASYTAIQILAARRESRLRIWTRGGGMSDEDKRRDREFVSYQVAVPLMGAALALPGRDAVQRLVAAVVLAHCLGLIVHAVARRPAGAPARVLSVVVTAAVLLPLFWITEETWRMLAATCVPALLTVRNFIEHRRRSGPPTAAPAAG